MEPRGAVAHRWFVDQAITVVVNAVVADLTRARVHGRVEVVPIAFEIHITARAVNGSFVDPDVDRGRASSRIAVSVPIVRRGIATLEFCAGFRGQGGQQRNDNQSRALNNQTGHTSSLSREHCGSPSSMSCEGFVQRPGIEVRTRFNSA